MKRISKSVSHDWSFLRDLKYEMRSETFCQIVKTYVIQFMISISYYSNLIKRFFHFANHCSGPSADHSRKPLIINFWYSALTLFFIKTEFDFVESISNFNHCFTNKFFHSNAFFLLNTMIVILFLNLISAFKYLLYSHAVFL